MGLLAEGVREDDEGGRARGAGGASVTSLARVVKRVQRWRTPSVARWLRESRVRCPARSVQRWR